MPRAVLAITEDPSGQQCSIMYVEQTISWREFC